jgi:hypothetical protein
MATNDYHFITNWRIEGSREEVVEVIGDALSLTRWWPSVYLGVTELEPNDPVTHTGRVIDLYTKGWLPYTLRWSFRVTENRGLEGFTLEAWGDFDGRGIWTFEQDGNYVNIIYDWKIRADKPLLRNFSFIMRPLFAANHRWAMAKGEESLKLELARRHAKTDTERARIPAPPPATPSSPVPLLAGTAAAGLAIAGLVYMVSKLLAGDSSESE